MSYPRPVVAAAIWLIVLAGCGDTTPDEAIDFSPPDDASTSLNAADPTGSTAVTAAGSATTADDSPSGDEGDGASVAEPDSTVPEPATVPPDPTTSALATDEPGTNDSTDNSGTDDGTEIRFLVPQIHAEYPHDATAYTQGLEFHDGLLLESTGLEGASSMRRVDPVTGRVLDIDPIQVDFFAEGLTVVDGRVNQLTWKNGVMIERDPETLAETARVGYSGEGWGLCDDGARLVMSDGSDRLTFRDRATFDATGSVAVTFRDEPVFDLNELECVDGTVWANVWQSDVILGIDPESGRTGTVVDVSSLVPEQYVGDTDNVVNGIAHHPETGRFWLTGKRWPVMYEVTFVER